MYYVNYNENTETFGPAMRIEPHKSGKFNVIGIPHADYSCTKYVYASKEILEKYKEPGFLTESIDVEEHMKDGRLVGWIARIDRNPKTVDQCVAFNVNSDMHISVLKKYSKGEQCPRNKKFLSSIDEKYWNRKDNTVRCSICDSILLDHRNPYYSRIPGSEEHTWASFHMKEGTLSDDYLVLDIASEYIGEYISPFGGVPSIKLNAGESVTFGSNLYNLDVHFVKYTYNGGGNFTKERLFEGVKIIPRVK